MQDRQFDPQHLLVPTGASDCELIIRNDQSAHLRGRQMLQHDYGDLLHAEFTRSKNPCVPRQDAIVAVD